MNKTRSILRLAISIALAFTFSCSSNDFDDGGDSSSPSSGGSSSPSNGNRSSSSSNGQSGSFNLNSQIYYYDSDNILQAYKGSGDIDVSSHLESSRSCYSDDECSSRKYEWDHIRAGSVTNGIVNLNLPRIIPDEYLKDFLGEEISDDEVQRYCTSYTKGIKGGGGAFVLSDKNGNFIGILRPSYEDNQIGEYISYLYFSKAGKIACNFGTRIYNIDAKEGWNVVYVQQRRTAEASTNNILTKEKDIKWIIIELKE